ncbi:MFS transporter [Bifidobacterium sp. ESL0800]|uniref:MFS transporter n=1 Tax=Bifidobacterium sp. ESL0800 TaxID=2983236 RepID=UPI0023F7472E|nr:MFS transporter [Bifidobacterium sp. ESL0800]WEV75182.1 MFS transporter [Bifidobacterium sp. ESL0800]
MTTIADTGTQQTTSKTALGNPTCPNARVQTRPQQTGEIGSSDESQQPGKPAPSPLRSGNFVLLIAGQGLSLFGNTMLRFAMSMWVLDETGSATVFATLLSISIVPTIALMPFGGVIADRVNRRTMMVALDAVSGCVVLAATLSFGFMQVHTIASIAVLLIALSVLDALESPTVSAAIPQMLGRTDTVLLRRAQAISSQVNAVMQIIPTFAGGALYALIGIRTMMAGTTVCFFVTASLECFIELNPVRRADRATAHPDQSASNRRKAHITEALATAAENGCLAPTIETRTGDSAASTAPAAPPLQRAHNNPPVRRHILSVFLADTRDAAAFVKANPTLLELCVVIAALNFFLNGVSSVGSPYIIRTALHFGADVYGYCDGIMSVVSLLDTLLTTALAAKLLMRHMPTTIAAAALCFVPIAVVFAFPVARSAKLVTFIAAFCLLTLAIDFTNIIISPTLMTLIPDELMGKIMALVNAVCLCASPLGQMTYGLLFDRVAITPIVVGTGVCLAIGALILTPMCRRFGREESAQ